MPTLNNFFILSPEHTGGKREEEYHVKDYNLDALKELTSPGLAERVQEPALFIPGLLNTQETLFYLLKQERIPDPTKEFGYVLHGQNELFALSLPAAREAKKYMYYSALAEFWRIQSLHDKHYEKHIAHHHKDHHHKKEDKKEAEKEENRERKDNLFLDIEKKVYFQARNNKENLDKFLAARVGFFEGILDVQKDKTLMYALQIADTLKFLKEK